MSQCDVTVLLQPLTMNIQYFFVRFISRFFDQLRGGDLLLPVAGIVSSSLNVDQDVDILGVPNESSSVETEEHTSGLVKSLSEIGDIHREKVDVLFKSRIQSPSAKATVSEDSDPDVVALLKSLSEERIPETKCDSVRILLFESPFARYFSRSLPFSTCKSYLFGQCCCFESAHELPELDTKLIQDGFTFPLSLSIFYIFLGGPFLLL